MLFDQVCLESLGYCLPPSVVTTAELERRLAPVYQRLRLPEGRLELMTGIAERRFWDAAMLPSDPSIVSAGRAIEAANFDPGRIGMLIHASVCRDQMEPATACRVHSRLDLPNDCVVFDTSNACLGMVNGMLQAATMIQLGQIEAALVVGTENGAGLVENTIQYLNQSPEINRQNIKLAIASLTIGSASAAVLLTHKNISRTQTQLQAVVARADTQHYELCQGDHDRNDGQNRPLMNTDSETLMARGVDTGELTFQKLLQETKRSANSVDRSICHQVGMAHRKLMLERLQLNPAHDFATVQCLGNTGACAVPVTLAIAAQLNALQPGHDIALLGIGSGINCVMASVRWQATPVLGEHNLSDLIPPSATAVWHLASV